jgi:uncharacterized membrane protein YgdD (TMEM256/DUF423 family)
MQGLLIFAALNGALAVMGGAFAAHALDPVADAARIGWLKTAAEYQLIHALAMLAAASLGAPKCVLLAFAAGIVLFSGSLYLLAITGVKILGAITPLGGLCFIGGWLMLAWSFYRRAYP